MIEEGPARCRDQSYKREIEDIYCRENSLAGSDTSYGQVWRAEQENDSLCYQRRWTVPPRSRVATKYST